MSTQLTVRLPEDLSRAVASTVARLQRKRSEIVQMALYQFLQLSPRKEDTPAVRVQHLVGSLESGIPDLTENHRAYVLESLKNGG